MTARRSTANPRKPARSPVEADAEPVRNIAQGRALKFEIGVLSDNIGYVMRRAQLSMYADLRDCLDANNMTPQRYTALALIGANRNFSQADLGNLLNIARSGAMAIVNALERQGCITRTRIPEDRRSYLLRITPEGERIVSELHSRITLLDRRASKRLTKEERRQLLDMLERLAAPFPPLAESTK